jgi:dipeptidyl aminopeptidase/acylaminoacyl peptidase
MFARSLTTICLTLLISSARSSAADAVTWTPAQSLRVASAGSAMVSPDGAWVAFTVTRAVSNATTSDMRTHIYIARTDGSGQQQLTRGEKSCTNPVWLPDSRTLLFATDREQGRQIWKLPIDGGEATQLTKWNGSLANWTPSPDGKLIAFTGTPMDTSRGQATKEKRDWKVMDEAREQNALYVVDMNWSRAPRRLAGGSEAIGSFDWSPDSSRIAFDRRPNGSANDARFSDVLEVEVESARVLPVSTSGASESNPSYSPDGKWLAFARSGEPVNLQAPLRIALRNRSTGSMRDLPATPEESSNIIGWSADSRALLISEALGTRSAIYTVPVDGPLPAPRRFDSGVVQGAALNASSEWLSGIWQTPNTPPEVYVQSMKGGEPQRVSSLNTALKVDNLPRTEVVRWKNSKDGKEVEGLLTWPTKRNANDKVPLVLIIHGGPSGVFSEGFIGSAQLYPIAAFAEKGYAVLRANCRGSIGYGKAFRASNFKDWGVGDYQDLMSGVDHVIGMGLADPDRLAVMGWSYGGYMTAWVVSQTQRFKAAAVGAGLTNLISMYGTNDIPAVLEDYFDGAPWDQPELYAKASAMYYVKNVTTPTLFLHGEQDDRVPIGQAFEYYSALKRRKVPTEMVTYPRTPHGPREPRFMADIMQRHLDWAEKYLKQ